MYSDKTLVSVSDIPYGDICVYPTSKQEWTFAIVGEAPGCFDVASYARTVIYARALATARCVDVWIFNIEPRMCDECGDVDGDCPHMQEFVADDGDDGDAYATHPPLFRKETLGV